MGASYDLNALSGINAASSGLGVISNNLANAQSVGFKSSRAEFADMFSGSQNSPGNGVRLESITQDFGQGTINGTGRELDMAIDGEGFFILEDKTGKYDNVYTRNGSFKLDSEGLLTDQEGNQVQGFLLNESSSTESNPVFDSTLSSIDLDALNREPRATDEMTYDLNLDGQEDNNLDNNLASIGSVAAGSLEKLVDADAAGSYGGFPDFSTNKIIHDSLGGEHRLTSNFYKRDVVTSDVSDLAADGTLPVDGAGVTYGAVGYDPTTSNASKYTSWIVQYSVQDYDTDSQTWVTSGHTLESNTAAGAGQPGTDEGMLFELRFDTNGDLIDVREPISNTAPVGQDLAGNPLPNANWNSVGNQPAMQWVVDSPITGATDPLGGNGSLAITADFQDMSQFAGTYNLRGVSQNGYKVGDLVGLSTGLDGTIEARYSNGRSIPVARLGVANFSDKNALEKLGGQTYAQTFASGDVQEGKPQESGFGTIQAGSLEYSNVDVAGELVNMIQTQRTYQASAQVISTSQTLTQTILNL